MRAPALLTVVAAFVGCATTPPPPPTPPPQCVGQWRPTSRAGAAPIDQLDKGMIIAGMAAVKPCVRTCLAPTSVWERPTGEASEALGIS
jgi:hypothetical protein